MTPDLVQLVELADRAGWRVVQTRRNHFAFYSPDGKTIITVAGTPFGPARVAQQQGSASSSGTGGWAMSCSETWHTSHEGVGITRFGHYVGGYGNMVRQPCPDLPYEWNAARRLLVEVARANRDPEMHEALLHVTRGDEVQCRHCGTWGPAGEDHTCSCPNRDEECAEHPRRG